MKELTVTIESQHNQPLPEPLRYTLEEDAFSIGRSQHNDLQLDDKRRGISRIHCRIFRQDGGFFVSDESSNGLFINAETTPLGRGNRQRLRHNDLLKLGPYQVRVSIHEAAPPPPPVPLQEADEDPLEGTQFIDLSPEDLPAVPRHLRKSPPTPSRPASPPAPAPVAKQASEDRTDPFAGYPPPAEPGSARRPGQNDPPGPPPSATESRPPAADAGPGEPARVPPARPDGGADLPDLDILLTAETEDPTPPVDADALDALDALLLGRDARPTTPPPPPTATRPAAPVETWPAPEELPTTRSLPVTPPAPSQEPARPPAAPSTPARATDQDTANELLRAFLDGAGLPPLPLEAERQKALFRDLGVIFRMTVENLIQMLAARGSNKEEMDLDMTTMQSQGNNPLKFPRSEIESTLALLLVPSGRGYMPTVQAFQETFEDINRHYSGSLGGFNAALKALLARFEPDALEERLNEHSRLSDLFRGSRGGRYWEAYRELYQEIADQAHENFLALIRDDFCEVYISQQRPGDDEP